MGGGPEEDQFGGFNGQPPQMHYNMQNSYNREITDNELMYLDMITGTISLFIF